MRHGTGVFLASILARGILLVILVLGWSFYSSIWIILALGLVSDLAVGNRGVLDFGASIGLPLGLFRPEQCYYRL